MSCQWHLVLGAVILGAVLSSKDRDGAEPGHDDSLRDGVDELDKDLAEAFVHISRKYKKIRQPFPTSTTITWNKPHFFLGNMSCENKTESVNNALHQSQNSSGKVIILEYGIVSP